MRWAQNMLYGVYISFHIDMKELLSREVAVVDTPFTQCYRLRLRDMIAGTRSAPSQPVGLM